MELSSVFQEIESLYFRAELAVGSRLSTILTFADTKAPVQELWEVTKTPEGVESLLLRVKEISKRAEGSVYSLDIALSVYLNILETRDRKIGIEAAAMIETLPGAYWSAALAGAILSQHEVHSQAGE